VNDPAFRELYVRWFQFGAFSPIFRSHGTGTPREVWQFGNPGDREYETLVKFIHLRYRLLPYIYSVAWKITSEGYTMMRGLPMDFPHDPAGFSIDDQFLFGPAILVKPVTREMYHLAKGVGETVPADCLTTDSGAPGLTAEYFDGVQFNRLVNTRVDPAVEFDWNFAAPEHLQKDNYSVRWRGKLVAKESGTHEIAVVSEGSAALYIDGEKVIDNWQEHRRQVDFARIELEANTPVDIVLEYAKYLGSAEIMLAWKTPSRLARQARLPEKKTVPVYLPGSCAWYDFWTGEKFSGGQFVERDAPLEIMPLFVRAGSIIPLGPKVQYASEKPADPIELRIYTGADGQFMLYEDENDNYNYERGMYATIVFRWDDAEKSLEIGERKGEFPGMLNKRTFRIVLVREGQGVGEELTAHEDKSIEYDGKATTVRF